MVLRQVLFSALKMAARNPAVRKQAAKAAHHAADAARPSLLKASRKAGELVRAVGDELSDGAQKFKEQAQKQSKNSSDDM